MTKKLLSKEQMEAAFRLAAHKHVAMEVLGLIRQHIDALAADNAALRAFCEAFAATAEDAVANAERSKGGQHVPFFGDFARVGPSDAGRLRWWAREARAALGGTASALLIRARNEGLEKAARLVDCTCVAPEGFVGEWHHMACTVRKAADIRAMKEPET